MSADIERRKLSIIEHLAEVEDETVINQIENLLKPTVDFWEELSKEEQAAILRGKKDLEAGRKAAYETFMSNYRNRI
ncbi:MAG: hypothetical protein GVY26_15660 [Bacteroidetes bacterium]|jgi:hypothetical protein|nr:hypothetical protein [Bacteroidota bacterium]